MDTRWLPPQPAVTNNATLPQSSLTYKTGCHVHFVTMATTGQTAPIILLINIVSVRVTVMSYDDRCLISWAPFLNFLIESSICRYSDSLLLSVYVINAHRRGQLGIVFIPVSTTVDLTMQTSSIQ